jgi:hypothetical protein
MKDLHIYLTQVLGLGKIEVALAEAVFARSPQMHALGSYSGGNLPHGQSSAHKRWIDELKKLQQGFVDMEIRAAKMKVVRKTIMKEVSRFHNSSGGIGERKFHKTRLPKLTDEVFHNMLVFHEGVIHELNMKRLSSTEAKSHLMSKLCSLKKDNLEEVNYKRLYIDMYAVPKHLDGKKKYASVRHLNNKFRLDNLNVQEIWIRTPSGWKFDSRTK